MALSSAMGPHNQDSAVAPRERFIASLERASQHFGDREGFVTAKRSLPAAWTSNSGLKRGMKRGMVLEHVYDRR